MPNANDIYPDPKPRKPLKSKAYLDYIRGKACLFCGQRGPSQAHHVRFAADCGMGTRPTDLVSVPTCPACHDAVHSGTGAMFREIMSRVGVEEILQNIVDNLVMWTEMGES